jgi:hypothetical protein
MACSGGYPHKLQFASRDLPRGLIVAERVVQAALMTGEHPSKDRHGAFLRLSVGAAEADQASGAVLAGGQGAEVCFRVHATSAARWQKFRFKTLPKSLCIRQNSRSNSGRSVRARKKAEVTGTITVSRCSYKRQLAPPITLSFYKLPASVSLSRQRPTIT